MMTRRGFVKRLREQWQEKNNDGSYVVTDEKLKEQAEFMKWKFPLHSWKFRYRKYMAAMAIQAKMLIDGTNFDMGKFLQDAKNGKYK